MTKCEEKTSIRPLRDRIVVSRDEAMSQTDGGIFIPEEFREHQKTGRVLAVGQGNTASLADGRIPLEVKPGDRVVFSAYAGISVTDNGRELLIMCEGDVLAVID